MKKQVYSYSRKIIFMFITVATALSICGCSETKNNNDMHIKDEQTVETVARNNEVKYINMRYFETNDIAYFGERVYGMDTVKIYNLCWYSKVSDFSKTAVNYKKILEDLTEISEDDIYFIKKEFNTYGKIYPFYLFSETCKRNDNKDKLYSKIVEQSIESVLECKQSDGYFEDEKTDPLFATCIAVNTLENLKYDMTKLGETYEWLVKRFRGENDNKGEAVDTLSLLNVANSILNFKEYKNYDKSIEKNILELAKYELGELVNANYTDSVLFNSTLMFNIITIIEKLDVDYSYKDIVNTDFYQKLSNSDMRTTDIQTIYEILYIISLVEKSDFDIRNYIDESEIALFFDKKLYLSNCSKSIVSDYFGMLLAQELEYNYDVEKMSNVLIDGLEATAINPKVIYYTLMNIDMLGLNADTKSLAKKLGSVQKEIIDDIEKNFTVELYFYLYQSYKLADKNPKSEIRKEIQEHFLNNFKLFKKKLNTDDYYYLLMLAEDDNRIKLDKSKVVEYVYDALYDKETGGFAPNVAYKTPNIASTYFALQIYDICDVKLKNIEKTANFIHSLHDTKNGGYKNSTDTSETLSNITYYAIDILKKLKTQNLSWYRA